MADDWRNIPGLKYCGPVLIAGQFIAVDEWLCIRCRNIFTLPVDGPIPHARDAETGHDLGAICDTCAMSLIEDGQ